MERPSTSCRSWSAPDASAWKSDLKLPSQMILAPSLPRASQVPAFSSRYVETAVELQAGQTFAIAGLLQSRTEAVTRATPWLGELPLVGVMFRRVTRSAKRH